MIKAGSGMFATALDELGAVLARTDEARIDAACEILAGAGKIAVYGCGREALQVKGLAAEYTLEDVKAKYKALVKPHRAVANGGDRSTEDRLSEIIKAYNYLNIVVRGA